MYSESHVLEHELACLVEPQPAAKHDRDYRAVAPERTLDRVAPSFTRPSSWNATVGQRSHV
jgi:hypothetical protein